MKRYVSLVLFAAAVAVMAQNFAVTSFTVDGGGGTSSGGAFSVSGTIAQPDAANVSTGGAYAVTAGFWAEFQTVQPPEGPLLAMRGSAGTLQVYWPAGVSGWVLQTSPSMAPNSWSDVSGNPLSNGTDQYHSFNVSGSSRLFFRLRPQ